MSEVRQLLGDLAVASVELVDALRPGVDLTLAERWKWVALEAGLAARGQPRETEVLAVLSEAFEGTTVLRELVAAHDDQFLHRAIGWDGACVTRSALELMRDLLDGTAPGEQLDTSTLETRMLRWGGAAERVLATPAGMPAHHWWWFGSRPPGERTLRANRRMFDLLGLGVLPVPLKWRQFVAKGFREHADALLFRELVREPNESLLFGGATSRFEGATNARAIEDFLERDPSRRPVDVAGIGLACARHLAGELRRRGAPACRIIFTLRPRERVAILRFHVRRPGDQWLLDDDLERFGDEAVLVLDTVDGV